MFKLMNKPIFTTALFTLGKISPCELAYENFEESIIGDKHNTEKDKCAHVSKIGNENPACPSVYLFSKFNELFNPRYRRTRTMVFIVC
jgi:hypothetical protein